MEPQDFPLSMKQYIRLLRIKHYIKNLLVFLPLVFSKELHTDTFTRTAIAALAFSLVSSSIYIVNDVKDREKDARHSMKCKRPIASGAVAVRTAVVLAAGLAISGLAVSAWVSTHTGWQASTCIAGYFVLNLLYSLKLKDMPVIEIAVLASGFVLRALLGGFAAEVEISNWLYLTILAGSFYMGLGKRRNEINTQDTSKTRKVLDMYNTRFLDRNMYMFLSLTIGFYSLWAVGQGSWMAWSIPMVMVTAMRYSLLVEKSESDGDPVEVICNDIPLMAMACCYGIYMLIALYA